MFVVQRRLKVCPETGWARPSEWIDLYTFDNEDAAQHAANLYACVATEAEYRVDKR